MRAAVRNAFNFIAAPVWSDYVIGPTGGLANVTDDSSLDAYIAAGAGTLFHPSGTAAMSAKGAKTGVVDPDLKVKGVSGLRIVDASVFVSLNDELPMAYADVFAIAYQLQRSPAGSRIRLCGTSV